MLQSCNGTHGDGCSAVLPCLKSNGQSAGCSCSALRPSVCNMRAMSAQQASLHAKSCGLLAVTAVQHAVPRCLTLRRAALPMLPRATLPAPPHAALCHAGPAAPCRPPGRAQGWQRWAAAAGPAARRAATRSTYETWWLRWSETRCTAGACCCTSSQTARPDARLGDILNALYTPAGAGLGPRGVAVGQLRLILVEAAGV